VTRTAQVADPGSKGRIWFSLAASSSTTSTRRPANRERNRSLRSSTVGGVDPAGAVLVRSASEPV
jgi:hypothetical protein